MARSWNIVGMPYGIFDDFGNVISTSITLTSTSDGYAIFTEVLKGDHTKKPDDILIKMVLEQYFKKEYTDYAVSEAVLKVDELEQSIKQVKSLQKSYNELIENTTKTAKETSVKLDLAEKQRNDILEVVLQKVNGYDAKFEDLTKLVNHFMDDVYAILEGDETNGEQSSERSTQSSEESEDNAENTGDENASV